MLKDVIAYADTPLRRIGLLCGAAAVALYIALGCYWHTKVEPFFSSKTDYWPIDTPEPAPEAGGAWLKDPTGYYWVLYDADCLSKSQAEQTARHELLILRDDRCIRRSVPSMDSRTEHTDSVGAFFSALVGGDRRSYRFEPYQKIAAGLLLAAILLYLGLADAVLNWVSGSGRRGAHSHAGDKSKNENTE